MGRLVGGLAGGMASEGVSRLVNGERPSLKSLLLTPGNMQRLGSRLSEMRGAAMKIGQLLSMDSGEVLPPELARVLERLRQDAHPMPGAQLSRRLEAAWGKGWEGRFRRFGFTPVAAASIGQVHRAELRDGRVLAVKVQHPGVRESIDSDVDNVVALLGAFRLLPEGMDIGPLLAEARRQLHGESDYRLEAAALGRFRERLGGNPRFQVPEVVAELSGEEVLAMTFLEGEPVEGLEHGAAAIREGVGSHLVELALQEVFQWGLVQTDPNFANYRYNRAEGCIQLLDFGAVREYEPARRVALKALLGAALDGTDGDLEQAAATVGYLGEGDPALYRRAVVQLLRAATEPARHPEPYPFGTTDLARRMSERVLEMRLTSRYTRLPPTDVLFLHRKLGGLYLLLGRLRARVPVRDLVAPYRDATPPSPVAEPLSVTA